ARGHRRVQRKTAAKLGEVNSQVSPVWSVLTHTCVTLPFDLCHLARDNSDIERSIAPDSFLLALFGDRIMAGRNQNAKASLSVRCELCHGTGFIADNESFVRQGFQTRDAGPNRSTMNGSHCNHAFDSTVACFRERGRRST